MEPTVSKINVADGFVLGVIPFVAFAEVVAVFFAINLKSTQSLRSYVFNESSLRYCGIS